jgi:hypothetical protein
MPPGVKEAIMKAFHFLNADMRAGSGNEEPWTVGETRTIEGEIVLCARGYHSSPSWWDALQYAPGPVACIVEIPGPKARHRDDTKQVTHSRTLVAARNVEREMRLFSCDVAEDVLPIFEAEYPEDKRPQQAIETARRYADGLATKEELAAAREAAWEAAWAAARAAAREAAWAAAGAAAWAAAWAAARAAAWDKYHGWFNDRMDALLAEVMA